MKRDFNTGANTGTNFCYFYLHINGQLISKPKHYDTELFEESEFVKCWWKIDPDNRLDIYKMLIRAHTLGADEKCLDNLIAGWQINDEECRAFIEREGLTYERQGLMWRVSAHDNRFGGISNTLFKALCLFYDLAVHA